MEGGRPAAAFLIAQVFNIFWTLLLAYLIFGGLIVAVPKRANEVQVSPEP